MTHNVSAIHERVEVLELTETAEGREWAVARKTWAGVELTGKTNLFSRVGIGARDALVLLRRQELTLHQALRWKGQHFFITEITEPERGWMEVRAAAVELVQCRANVHRDPAGKAFPGVLTEKYLRNDDGIPAPTSTVCYVLVTPKAVELEPNGLVEVNGIRYVVPVAHTLDPYKNEYEVMRKADRQCSR